MEVVKTVIFRAPWTVKMRLPLKRELNFHFSKGFPKESQNELKLSQNEVQIRPKTSRGRSQSVPKKVSKIVPENQGKREPKRTPQIVKNHEKRCPETRSITGGPLGHPRVDIGGTLGTIFMIVWCILVFPYVFLTFVM